MSSSTLKESSVITVNLEYIRDYNIYLPFLVSPLERI